MSEAWLTMKKVCALTGLAVRTIRFKAQSGEWATRSSESRGANGKREREFLLSSMSSDAQAKFAAEAKQGLLVVPAAEQTMPLFSASAPLLPSPQRVAIPEDLEDQARARLNAIEPLLDFRKRTNGHRPTLRLQDGRTVNRLNDLAEYVAAQQTPPISSRTLFRWLGRFDSHGYSALADSPRKDKGQSRFFDEHPAAATFLQQKFLHEGLSREMAWEALCRDWKKIGEKGPTPCYDTARNFLNALPEPLKVLARDGKETYERKCSPFIQRGKVPVMDWWVSDHRVFDVLVRNTVFAEKQRDEAYRLWLTAICDWGSQKIVGFCLSPNPSKDTINSAIRMAVLSHGFPANFYWDNGKDYKAVRDDLERMTLSEGARSLLQHQRISVTSAIPKRPRSKPIEAWFGRFSKRFDVLWRPAYLGNKPGNKPESAKESEKQHAKYLAGKRGDSPLPTDAEFIAATVQWIEEYNETRWQPLNHRTPNEVMEEARPERNRPKINPRLLDILFSVRDARVVQAGGCVQLNCMRYEPTEESLYAMANLQGRQVAILRDPYNLENAVAADMETLQFIGELRIQELIAQCPNGRITREQIKARLRLERGQRRGYGEYLAAVSAIATNQAWGTEREALVERALARTGTDGRLLPAAAPGARGAAPARRYHAMQPAFVSDAVAEDAEAFLDVKAED